MHSLVTEESASGSDDLWIIDSGATHHQVNRLEWFSSYGEFTSPLSIREGTILIDGLVDGCWNECRVEKVLYVPEVVCNLFTVKSICAAERT